MAVPAERNTSAKMVEKLSKYKDLKIKISRMLGLKTETVPVVIGALGLVKKGLEKYVERIPANTNIEDLQKISLLGTAHILREVLSIKRQQLPPEAPKETGSFSVHWAERTEK